MEPKIKKVDFFSSTQIFIIDLYNPKDRYQFVCSPFPEVTLIIIVQKQSFSQVPDVLLCESSDQFL